MRLQGRLRPIRPAVSRSIESTPSVSTQLQFLVVDENPDNRFLLAKTLLRKFPEAALVECRAGETALELARGKDFAAFIVHRTPEFAGAELVRAIRKINPETPILMMSGVDRRQVAMEAGANAFLLFDEWLLLGSVVAELLTPAQNADAPLPPAS
jgi:CheY-like chemotaxis protein